MASDPNEDLDLSDSCIRDTAVSPFFTHLKAIATAQQLIDALDAQETDSLGSTIATALAAIPSLWEDLGQQAGDLLTRCEDACRRWTNAPTDASTDIKLRILGLRFAITAAAGDSAEAESFFCCAISTLLNSEILKAAKLTYLEMFKTSYPTLLSGSAVQFTGLCMRGLFAPDFDCSDREPSIEELNEILLPLLDRWKK